MLETRQSAAGAVQAPMVQVVPIALAKSMSMGTEENAFGAGQIPMVLAVLIAQQKSMNIKIIFKTNFS